MRITLTRFHCIQAAEALRITAHELVKLNVVDEIIPVRSAALLILR